MNPFKQRSSIPSSFLTGLVGWLGFIFIGPLIFGFAVPAAELALIGAGSAIAQVIVLRVLFFLLHMHRHILVGAFWGGVTALGMYYATASFVPDLRQHQFYWVLIYLYIGPPVGAFLSYFYIDDKKIFDASGTSGKDADFGRDAHWLEPFGYGAAAYLVAFFPFNHPGLAVNVFIVGAMSGVFAAGASHFSPDRWKASLPVLLMLVLVLGGIQGAASGFLFRAYADQLYADKLIPGAAGGILTYFITFMRGRQLAGREKEQS
jgi:hypothetical protein